MSGRRTTAPARRRAGSGLAGTALRWSVFLVVVGFWQLVTTTLTPADYAPYFPPPSTIARTLYETWFSGPVSHGFLTGTAIHDLLPSLGRLLGGWALAAAVGIPAGVALGRSRHAIEYVRPLVHFARSIPATTLIPVFVVLFRFSTTMRVSVIVFGVVWPILLNAIEGARQVEPAQLDIARVFKLGRQTRLWLVVVPAAAPRIFAGLRISLSLSIILMVTSELVGATDGIGFFLSNAKKGFELPEMWSAIVLLGIVGYVLNTALLAVERRVLGWQYDAEEYR
ncbi:ABC transporter permease [Actinophytocola sp.]|uniref:ABC transporter permease n=1 Tax=Actinophytocola sp. TaxID=1872138 RepID=UPI002D5E2AFD|nr:ABC transporter permease [Actinophytocola sp.]HYQ67590.1 ABC transporter permease [Actinophytocola sp.]